MQAQSPYDVRPVGVTTHRWPAAHRPALVAAAWFWLVFLALALITLFTGWASRPVTLVLQLIASLGAGFLAARLQRRHFPGLPLTTRQGTLAGFYLPVATAVVIILVAILAGAASLGLLLPLMLPYFLFLPVEIGACSLLGALGAHIYRRWFAR